MLYIKDIFFRHKDEDILKGISFFAERGNVTTILGPNGSGKTTLFKCIAGLWKHYRGQIYFDQRSIDDLSFRKRARVFSMVPQDHDPPFPYSVMEIVLMGRASHMGIFSSPGKKDYEISENALKTLGIEDLKNKPYTKISGGERQLVLIARALAQDTPVMLLDEPTSHLDFRNQIKVLRKIKEISKDKGLVVIITLHDPNLAGLFSDKIIVLNSGTKIAEGIPGEILTEDLIRRVYGLEVKKNYFDGQTIICPVL